MVVEVCVDSFEQVKAAQSYGAKRVELCSALEVGGLTPSRGMTQLCASIKGIEVHAMIRPGAGGFSYSSEELEIMKFDVQALAGAGATGVVFGILDPGQRLDIEKNTQLITLAKSLGLEATFHRAFDFVQDPIRVLNQLIELGFNRILTSGQKPDAIEGIDLIRDLVLQSDRRIQIMAGSGIDNKNVRELQSTGIDAVHFTARKQKNYETSLTMGQEYEVNHDKIKAIFDAINTNQ